MKYKQEKSYGCGLYSVGNVFSCLKEFDNYVTPERLISSETGNNIAELSKWMLDDGVSYVLDYWYYNHEGGKLPAEYTKKYRPMVEEEILPVLLTVGFEKSSKMHMISGHVTFDGKIKIFDSLRDEYFIINFSEINDHYHIVNGLCCFLNLNHKDKYVILKYI